MPSRRRLSSPASAGSSHGRRYGDIFDNQPADRDASALALDDPPLLQGTQQHHGARDRQREAEDEARPRRPPHRPAQAHAEHGRHRDLRHRTRDGDRLHRQQVGQREVQADAEHQQDDTDLRQFVRQALVGDEPRRERADRDPRHQIADERRYLDAVGEGSEDEGEAEAGDDGGDERRVMKHP
jgi:hypothetical protein